MSAAGPREMPRIRSSKQRRRYQLPAEIKQTPKRKMDNLRAGEQGSRTRKKKEFRKKEFRKKEKKEFTVVSNSKVQSRP
jgi:hypothetical protein